MNLQESVSNNSSDIIENILTTLLAESHIEVRFDYQGKDSWADITYNNYDEDKEFSIRCYKDDLYKLIVGYYDDEDEFFEAVHILSQEQIDSIPLGLRKIMKKVLIDEDGLRVPSQLLVGKK